VYAVCWNGGWQRCRLSDDDGAVAQVDLIDVGISAALPADGLHAVDAETASPSRGLARRCRLWGLVPAGGSAWSRAAVEKFALLAAQGSAYFIETYSRFSPFFIFKTESTAVMCEIRNKRPWY